MKNKEVVKKPISKVLIVLLSVIVALLSVTIVAGCVFSYFGGFGTGPCADTDEFIKYAGAVSDITIPENTRIVALGEATHGNVEFQQLKLDVFKIMVERYGVRAFALESSCGGCEAANRYINGGGGTARDAVEALGFLIYQTDQMEELISWMRSYNDVANGENKLRFYGFDMQDHRYDYKYLLESVKDLGLDSSKLMKFWDTEKGNFLDECNKEQMSKAVENVKSELLGIDGSEAAQAIHFADILLQNYEIGLVSEDFNKYNELRDRFMYENVLWIMEQEETHGSQCVFVSAHNGHVERHNEYGDNEVMGSLLAEKFGNRYFVIGTDFYKARVNLPKSGDGKKRSNHTFYSYDPLAKASKKCGYETSWLDFSQLPEDSVLKQQIVDCMSMGQLGEDYSPIMAVMPTYRGYCPPVKLYDGMIFVSNAHPTEIRSK